MSGRIAAVLVLALVAAAPAPRGIVVVRAGRILTGTGECLERGMIVIQDGRIVAVRPYGEIPAGAELVAADGETVIPGLIDAHTALADEGRDADESVAPDIRALDGFDFHAPAWRLLAGGVTTVCISPGSRRLVSGQGAVVKTAGRVPEARVLKDRFGLRVTMGEASKSPPALYDPPVPASAERPLLPIQRQAPESRMGQFALLRKHAGALRATGQPLFVQAVAKDDLVKAVLFAAEASLPVVLVDAGEAPKVADFLAARKIPVILDPGFAPGSRDAHDSAPALDGLPALVKAGVPAAIQAPRDGDLRDLLFVAAAAVRQGLGEAEALAAVTRVPAEILGVADRVGSIQPGRDADLVFLGGDPFSASAEVRRVMIGGETVFRRKDADVRTFAGFRDTGRTSKSVLAIRGGRAITVTQGPVQDGLILVEDGRVTYVGRDRPLPSGAKVLDAAGLTIVPGFIDAGSHLGFADLPGTPADRRRKDSPVPATTPVPPARWVDPADPAFAAAAACGLTAVLVCPGRDGICSLLKLSKDRVTVLKEAAALKFTAQGGAAGAQALLETVKRGRRYVDEWDAYERAKREASATKPPERPSDPITGTWKGILDGGQGGRQEFSADLKLDATKVTGRLAGPFTAGKPESVEGTFEQNELKLSGGSGEGRFEVIARLIAADQVKGGWKRGEARGVLEARREPPPAVKPPAPPKEPKRDEALEPFRALFRREIPAIVAAHDLPAVKAAVKVFRQDFDLDLVLAGAETTVSGLGSLVDPVTGILFGPDFVVEEKGARSNLPEGLAARGMTLALGSSGTSSAKRLPLMASFAVRQGMDPFDALKALTTGPARLLRLEGRLGSIERGRDADLVFWSGDPFAPSSRVRRVMVDGKTVFEAP